MPSLVLVLDQGGHSSRALVFDGSGAVVAQASVLVGTIVVQPGWVEQDPAELVNSLRAVIAQVAVQLGERCHDIHAAALIVQRSSLVAWDRLSHQPLSPVLSWQDTRNSVWLDNILADKRNAIRGKTGLYPNAHYGASKIRWLLDNNLAVKNAADNHSLCIAPLASFLHLQLTDACEPTVDAVIASRTMLTEIGATSWSQELLDFFAIPEAVLPAIKPTLAEYGAISVGQCDVPLRLLGGDQSFFALSHGARFDIDTIFINAGTGAFIQQKMKPSSVPSALLCAPLLVTDSPATTVIVAEGTVNAAATALDWLWQCEGYAFSAADWQLAVELAEVAPASVPYFINRMIASGSPDWLPAGKEFFSKESPSALKAIAVLESIVFALQRNLDCLATVQSCERIVVSGGLSQLDIFCQRIADLSEKLVLRSDDIEACARGAAMQLLPAAAVKQDYREYIPQASEKLRSRYRQWSSVMDQLSCCG
jgi:glycerol kinase